MLQNINSNKFNLESSAKNSQIAEPVEELLEESKDEEEMENGASASAILFGDAFDKNFKASEIDYNL